MKISKRVREEAAMAMAICASQRETWPWFYEDIAPTGLINWLCGQAWDATYNNDDGTRYWRERYAEAESLLRTGWSPSNNPPPAMAKWR